jgi:hypothetical protein
VYNVVSSILGVNCGVGGSLIKKQTYLEKEHQSNDINRVEEPKKDKIKVNEEMKGENI